MATTVSTQRGPVRPRADGGRAGSPLRARAAVRVRGLRGSRGGPTTGSGLRGAAPRCRRPSPGWAPRREEAPRPGKSLGWRTPRQGRSAERRRLLRPVASPVQESPEVLVGTPDGSGPRALVGPGWRRLLRQGRVPGWGRTLAGAGSPNGERPRPGPRPSPTEEAPSHGLRPLPLPRGGRGRPTGPAVSLSGHLSQPQFLPLQTRGRELRTAGGPSHPRCLPGLPSVSTARGLPWRAGVDAPWDGAARSSGRRGGGGLSRAGKFLWAAAQNVQ